MMSVEADEDPGGVIAAGAFEAGAGLVAAGAAGVETVGALLEVAEKTGAR
jgi:3-keto-L-gulonate-6-phosphate decarboxylase